VDFRHAIVIMTSNIGAAQIAKNTGLGFSITSDETGVTYDDMKKGIMGELKKVFRPEFLNRIDEVIVFHKLAKDEIREIVDLLLKRIRKSMADRELSLNLSDDAKDLLVEKGWDPAMGARPLRRAIQRYIEDPLADEVLKAQIAEGSTIDVDRAEGKDGEDPDVNITITAPKKRRKKVAAGVGAEGSGEGEGGEGDSDVAEPEAAADLPEEPEVLPEAPDAPPADEPES
jgi:ATP-dependent Clp protease ATP-binding subunit ClpC